MEHWQKILLGTSIASVAAFIFYFLFYKLFKITKGSSSNLGRTVPIPYQFTKRRGRRRGGQDEAAAAQRLIFEEFDSPDHDVVGVVLCDNVKSVGICLFLQERKVEYFSENLPKCCLKDANDRGQGVTEARAGLAAVSLWAPQFHLANSVTFLFNDRTFVEEANTPDTVTASQVSSYEERHDFRLQTQWTDNYICDLAANTELWEGLVECGNKLLATNDGGGSDVDGIADEAEIWSEFPCEEWQRSRVRLNGHLFHQHPHAGPIDDVDHGQKSEPPLIAL